MPKPKCADCKSAKLESSTHRTFSCIPNIPKVRVISSLGPRALLIVSLLVICSTSLAMDRKLLLEPYTSVSFYSLTDREIEKRLSSAILSNPDLPLVLEQAKTNLSADLNAGSGYGEVWIRDLNTFIELALDVQSKDMIRQSLLVFFHFQGKDGEIIDGYIPAEAAKGTYKYTHSESMPGFRGHKNTVESDQESSLIQAVYKYVRKTGDYSILDKKINSVLVRQRLSLALDYLLGHRYSPEYGLIWGATTADWGDVQPEYAKGNQLIELDENSHRAIDIYDNAMFIIALCNYIDLTKTDSIAGSKWQNILSQFKTNARKHLWDPNSHKFLPHIYLDRSPFPPDFDEQRIYYHGGTAIAIEAGLLSRHEVLLVFKDMVNNKRFAGAASIGLTVYPPYPKGFFKNSGMDPFLYQNGGDWTWFGGRMIQQLVAHGYVNEAYQEIQPMIARVKSNKGFFEWYTIDNRPEGSGAFRGEAGVLGRAIQMLLAWAEEHR